VELLLSYKTNAAASINNRDAEAGEFAQYRALSVASFETKALRDL
jgi:hypothetical protein